MTFYQFSSVQLLSRVWLFVTPWTVARQASLSITNSRSPPKPMSIVLVMLSNHLILCCSLLHLPSVFLTIRVFSNELALPIRWPKDWSFTFSISPSVDIQDWFPLAWTCQISLQSKGLSRVFSNTSSKASVLQCISGLGIDLDYYDIEWFALEMDIDYFIIFDITPMYFI